MARGSQTTMTKGYEERFSTKRSDSRTISMSVMADMLEWFFSQMSASAIQRSHVIASIP